MKKEKGKKERDGRRKGRRWEEIKACKIATVYGTRENFFLQQKITTTHTTSINMGSKEMLGNKS